MSANQEPDMDGFSDTTAKLHRLKESIEALIESSKAALEEPAPPRPPAPQTKANWDTRPFDPETKWLTKNQLNLCQVYSIGGWAPAIDSIYYMVKEDQSKLTNQAAKTAHRHITDDWDEQSPKMASLLACIPSKMLTALIEGNITEPYLTQDEMNQEVKQFGTPDHLPGVYIIEVVNKEYDGPKKHPFPGRCLNWHEWNKLVPTMRRYTIAYRCGQLPTYFTEEFDKFVPSSSKDIEGFRYIESDVAAEKIELFINKCQEMYVDWGTPIYNQNPNDPRLSVPFKRLPREVGWGTYSGNRASQHQFQAQTNYLLGFYDTALRYTFGLNRFEQRVYLACRVSWAMLAQTGEYLVSMLAQSYWYDGGLNPTLAGTIKVQGTAKSNITHEHHRESLRRNADFLVDSGLMRRNIDEQKEFNDQMAAGIKWLAANPHNVVWPQIQQRKADLSILLEDLRQKIDNLCLESLNNDLEETLKALGLDV